MSVQVGMRGVEGYIHTFVTSVLGGSEWSALEAGRLTPNKSLIEGARTPGRCSRGREILAFLRRRNVFILLCITTDLYKTCLLQGVLFKNAVN